jgi:outer membrane protein X
MKKLMTMVAIILLCASSAMAQKGVKAVGGQFTYLTDSELSGIGFKFQYGITNPLRFEGSIDNYFKSDGLSMWDINANLHYRIPFTRNFALYPLAGMALTNWNTDGDGTQSKVGVNVGCGVEIGLAKEWALNFESKYQIIDNYNQIVLGAGLMYKF